MLNMDTYKKLAKAHELAVRQEELYQAMLIVEQCGASVELTNAIIRLGNRMTELQSGIKTIIKEEKINGD